MPADPENLHADSIAARAGLSSALFGPTFALLDGVRSGSTGADFAAPEAGIVAPGAG